MAHVESSGVTRNSIGVSSPVGKQIGSSMAFVIIVLEVPSRSRSHIGETECEGSLWSLRKEVSTKDRSDPQLMRAENSELSIGGAETEMVKDGSKRVEVLRCISGSAHSGSTQPLSSAEFQGLLSLFSSWSYLLRRPYQRNL